MSRLRPGDAVRIALLTGVGGFLAAVASGVLALGSVPGGVAIGVRAVLVTALLVAVLKAVLRGRPASALLPTAATGLLAGYALDLAWVSGSAYVARAVTQDVVLCALVDLALWLACGLASLRLVPSTPDGSPSYR